MITKQDIERAEAELARAERVDEVRRVVAEALAVSRARFAPRVAELERRLGFLAEVHRAAPKGAEGREPAPAEVRRARGAESPMAAFSRYEKFKRRMDR